MLAVFSDDSIQQEIRIEVDREGVSWWHGTHVCDVLELQNPTLTLQRHVDPDFRQQISWGDRGKPAWYISKPGLYQLIFASKVARAKAFQRWVFKEVLPTIRKTGSFEAVPNIESQGSEMWQIVDSAIARGMEPERGIDLHHRFVGQSRQPSAIPTMTASKMLPNSLTDEILLGKIRILCGRGDGWITVRECAQNIKTLRGTVNATKRVEALLALDNVEVSKRGKAIVYRPK